MILQAAWIQLLTRPHEHNDEMGNKAGKHNGEKLYRLAYNALNCLSTIMLLYIFNNVCNDGVIQQ